MANNKTNVPAVTAAAGLAGRAVSRLEAAAAKVLNGGTPTLQLTADTGGITALITDEHGVAVTIQHGRISVNVEQATEGAAE